MRRRSVLIAGLVALLLAPEWAGAQQAPVKIPRVGILSVVQSERAAIWDAFRQGLRDLRMAAASPVSARAVASDAIASPAASEITRLSSERLIVGFIR
jgi:hypothetical protein